MRTGKGKGSAVMSSSLAGGKGFMKGGKGGGKHNSFLSGAPGSMNPRGADGNIMKCHECDSERHLVAACPQRAALKGGKKGGRKGRHFVTTTGEEISLTAAYSGAAVEAQAPPASQPPRAGALAGANWFVGASTVKVEELDRDPSTVPWQTLLVHDEAKDEEEEDDDGDERRQRTLPQGGPSNVNWFPWWRIEQLEAAAPDADHSYLVKTRMKNKDGEALLVDPGSLGNLTGDEWSKRMAASAQRHGRAGPREIPLDNVLEVGGVGNGSQQAKVAHRHELMMEGGRPATYEAPVLPNSSVPALLGRSTLKAQRCLLDCYNNQLYRIGPGGYTLQLSGISALPPGGEPRGAPDATVRPLRGGSGQAHDDDTYDRPRHVTRGPEAKPGQ